MASKTIQALAALTVMLAASGCNGIADDEHHAKTRDEAGMASIAVLNVTRWEDIAGQLQTDFSLSAEEALAKVVPTSAFGNLSIRDIFGFSAAVALPTSTLSKTTTTSTNNDITTTAASKTKSSGPGTVPEIPDLLDPSKTSLPSSPATDKEPGINPNLQYQAAKDLFEEVKLLNNAMKSIAMRSDEEAYVVRLKVGVIPYARRQPYDVYTRISFFIGDKDVIGAGKPPATIAPMMKNLSEELQADEYNKKKPASVRVVPLIASDVLEASLQSRAEDQVRQFGLAVSLMLQGVGVGADLQKLEEILKSYKAREYSSLLTISPLTETTVQARFGAQFNSAGRYTMQERSQFVTVLLITSKNLSNRDVQTVARTTFRNANTGEALPVSSRTRIAEDLKRTVMPLFINQNPVVDKDYTAKQTAFNCSPFYEQDVKNKVDSTTAFLRDLYRSVVANDVACFLSALEFAGNEWQTPYWQTVWSEMAGIAATSEYASAAFSLPESAKFSLATSSPVLLLDDGKQTSRGTLYLKNRIDTGRLTASLELSDNSRLFGTVSAGTAANLVNITFPSLAALGLNAGNLKLHVEDASARASLPVVYKAAKIEKPPATVAFKFTQTTKTIVAAKDSSGSARVNIVLVDKDAGGKPKKLADKAVLSVSNAEFRGFDPAPGVSATGDTITATANATLVLNFRNLVPNQAVTVTATGSLGNEKTEIPLSFNVVGQ